MNKLATGLLLIAVLALAGCGTSDEEDAYNFVLMSAEIVSTGYPELHEKYPGHEAWVRIQMAKSRISIVKVQEFVKSHPKISKELKLLFDALEGTSTDLIDLGERLLEKNEFPLNQSALDKLENSRKARWNAHKRILDLAVAYETGR